MELVSNMGNFRPSRTSVSGPRVLSYAAANDTGGGFDGAAGVTMYVAKVNGEIITTILVDLEGLVVSGTRWDIIGEDGVAATYITRITPAVNGVVYKSEMSCIELPAGTNTTTDIDLATNDESLAEDVYIPSTGTTNTLINAKGPWTSGRRVVSTPTQGYDSVNHYLYLINGSGANSGGTYTAGKLVIKLYGAKF